MVIQWLEMKVEDGDCGAVQLRGFVVITGGV